MTDAAKEQMIKTITEREALRPLTRLKRLARSPVRTLPYYVLATLGHIKPLPLTYNTLWGTKMTSYLPEGNTFYFYGYCEASLTNFFLRHVKEGMSCLDIGAHVGFYSMLFSELVGPNGSVHSFEPTPWTFRLLSKNAGGLGNTNLSNAAVSDRTGTVSFADYGPGYGAFNSAHKDGAAHIARRAIKAEVPTIVIDQYVREKGLRPDIIKLDAEGFEANILKGMKETLALYVPIVTLEVAGEGSWAENRKECFALLAEADYVPFEPTLEGRLIAHTLRDSYGYDNLVFIPRQRFGEFNK